jgi:molecular chaperone Hsp33
MKDELIRATALDGKVRAFAIRSTELVEEARRRHDTWPTASAALGRTITAAAMMGAMLKGNEKLTTQIKGNGPLGQVVADANANGEVRGYVDNPHVHLPPNALGKLDVAGAVGTEGFLYVIKDVGMKEPYRGSVPIVSGELGDDFTYYFYKSEQTPSAVGLGVLVNPDNSIQAAGGFIVQLLPGMSDEEITELEKKLASLPSVTDMVKEGETPEQILNRLLSDVKVLEKTDVRFQCTCSKDRLESVLISLGIEEIAGIRIEQGEAEVICHFCNEKYLFSEQELVNMEEGLKS